MKNGWQANYAFGYKVGATMSWIDDGQTSTVYFDLFTRKERAEFSFVWKTNKHQKRKQNWTSSFALGDGHALKWLMRPCPSPSSSYFRTRLRVSWKHDGDTSRRSLWFIQIRVSAIAKANTSGPIYTRRPWDKSSDTSSRGWSAK